MNPLARWNQSRWKQVNELEVLQSLGSLFSRSCVRLPEQPLSAPQQIPLVAVRENARGDVLKAELPQVKQADAKITLDDDTLTIIGDRTFDVNRKRGQPVEHACGRFAHRFAIPADARPAKASSVFKNGVLMVHLASEGEGTAVEYFGHDKLERELKEGGDHWRRRLLGGRTAQDFLRLTGGRISKL